MSTVLGNPPAPQDPATGEYIASCPEFDKNDTTSAIEGAAAAFKSFRTSTKRRRADLLRRWFELMLENLEDLATIITWENGKPLADSRTEVRYAADFLQWFSEEAPRMIGATIGTSTPGNHAITLREPVGVCALIAPWNFPAAMITRKVGPALAAGCTAVVKAPAEAPLTALALMALAERAGVPAGVVNCITALEKTVDVGETLTTSLLVSKVSFTGSTTVGRLLMRQSASTLKRLSFELGGNAAFIVFDDADLDLALQGLIASKFRISGQTCVCANRVFVHESVHDKFVLKCIDALKKFRIGHGLAPGTTHGPLIHARAVARVEGLVQDAVSKGAKVAQGGQRLQHLGPTFFDMTILTNVNRSMKLFSEEIFGPVAAFCKFKDEEEVVSLANDTHMGLAGYFFSKDNSRCWRVAEALEVGMVGINTGVISDPAVPFGGIKQSGFGREGSFIGIEEYLSTKMVMTGNL